MPTKVAVFRRSIITKDPHKRCAFLVRILLKISVKKAALVDNQRFYEILFPQVSTPTHPVQVSAALLTSPAKGVRSPLPPSPRSPEPRDGVRWGAGGVLRRIFTKNQRFY